MFKDFPSLHPFAVHFPIVLILIAAVFQAVLVWKDWKQIRWATLIIMAVAFFSALATSTFFHAEPMPDAPKAAMEMFEAHEKYAQYTLWMSGITLLLKAIGVFFKINKRIYEVIVLIAAIIAAGFLSVAAHHGARLTHIAGVGPMGRYLMKEHGMDGDMKDIKGMKGDSTMKMDNKMPGMDTMQNMKGMDNKKDMKGMDNMKEMKAMDNKKDMKGMNNMKDMKGMDNMKGMKGMDNKKDMKGMDNMDNMKDMKGMNNTKDMKGMDNKKDMKGMDNMKDMKGMDNMKGMKDMPGMNKTKMGEMKNMDMPMKSAMDSFRFPDNNPALKKTKKPNKQ